MKVKIFIRRNLFKNLLKIDLASKLTVKVREVKEGIDSDLKIIGDYHLLVKSNDHCLNFIKLFILNLLEFELIKQLA